MAYRPQSRAHRRTRDEACEWMGMGDDSNDSDQARAELIAPIWTRARGTPAVDTVGENDDDSDSEGEMEGLLPAAASGNGPPQHSGGEDVERTQQSLSSKACASPLRPEPLL